jgi:hypothetical protein
MAKTTRERRAEERAQRRAQGAQASQPPELEDALDGDGTPSPGEALRTAASAAIAGAAVGAAQALARRRHAVGDDAEEEPVDPDQPEPSVDERVEDEDGAGRDEEPPEPEAHDEPQAHDEAQAHDEPPRPIAAGDALQIVERARRQLRDLRGADAESVSSIRHSSDGWRIGLEVVEVRRIPESTDVLGTYEVTLDDDGNLITFERTARYYRSEAERR